MNHAAAEDFQPIIAAVDHQVAVLFGAADVHLRRGFGEGKIARAKPHRQFINAEVGAAELDQRSLEMAHMGGLVDHQPLDLVEHRAVGGVIVGAKGAARRDDAQRRGDVFHVANLHRRGMGAQHGPGRAWRGGGQIKGVMVLAGRVPGRNVESLEVVKVVLDMRPLRHGEAHLAKDRHQFFHGLADRVDSADRGRTGGQGHIDAFGLQLRLQLGGLQRGLALLNRLGHHLLELVDRLAGFLARLGIQLAQVLHLGGDPALLAQRRDPRFVQRRRCRCRGNGPQQFGAKLILLLAHLFPNFYVHSSLARKLTLSLRFIAPASTARLASKVAGGTR